MQIQVIREVFGEKSTIGKLYIDGGYYCRTLEDKVRGEDEPKVYGQTAIPAGTYRVTLRTTGTTHEAYLKRFPELHKGTLWIRDIPGYEYVLIHCGNKPEDTLGCILVGVVYDIGKPNQIFNSELAYRRVYPVIADAIERGEGVTLQIY